MGCIDNMAYRIHGEVGQMKLKQISFTSHVPNLRYYSSTRPVKSRESKLSTRPPVIQLSRRQYPQRIPQSYSQISKSSNQKFKVNQNKACSRVDVIELSRESKENNGSLLIESLYAVPKQRRLNPMREKLLRLFNCNTKSTQKTHEKAVITFENVDWVFKDEVETPSPVIKPKYQHKG